MAPRYRPRVKVYGAGAGCILVMAAAMAAATGSAAELDASTGSPSVALPPGADSTLMTVDIFDNVVYLPVLIDGSGPFDFILDTGAGSLSAIDEGRAAALGLPSRPAGSGRGAGPAPVAFSRLGHVGLSFAGVEARDFRLVTVPLKRMEAHWGRPKEGLIGGNILGRLVTCINYDEATVAFSRPQSWQGAGRGVELPIDIEDGSILVRARVTPVGGGPAVEGRFVIDTAVRMSFLNTPFVRRHRLIESAPATVENVTGFGLGGLGFGTVARLQSVELAGLALEGPVVQLSTDTSGVAASRGFDGIIGADLLSRFELCIDYEGRRIHLAPGARHGSPFPYDMSGITVVSHPPDNRRFSVAHVVPGSAADTAGLVAGDGLLSIDGRPASSFTLESLKACLRSAPGARVILRVLRDGASREHTLTLRPLV